MCSISSRKTVRTPPLHPGPSKNSDAIRTHASGVLSHATNPPAGMVPLSVIGLVPGLESKKRLGRSLIVFLKSVSYSCPVPASYSRKLQACRLVPLKSKIVGDRIRECWGLFAGILRLSQRNNKGKEFPLPFASSSPPSLLLVKGITACSQQTLGSLTCLFPAC